MPFNERNHSKENTMLTFNEIITLSPEDFTKNWNNNNLQDSALKLLGKREMTDADKEHIETTK